MGNFLEEKLLPIANALASNKFFSSIRDGLIVSIPFSIIGAFALVIACFPLEAVTNFIGDFATCLFAISTVTIDCLGIFACVGISYAFGTHYEVDPISNVVISLSAFFMATLSDDFAINVGNFSAGGMFCAILISYVSTLIFKFFVNKNIVIKLPDGVPPAIANSFVSMLPAAGSILVVWLVRVVLGVDINSVITTIFSPLVSGMNSLPGYVFYIFLMCLLWVCGIHGDNALSPIASPIAAVLMAENMAAFAAGQEIPNIAVFVSMFVNFSGTGATIGLVLNMLLSKSERYQQLGKLSFLPALFNINEPVTFGTPIVMNPILAVPYILCPVVLTIATYLLMQFDIIGRVCVDIPWTTPPIIGAYLCTGLNLPAAIWNALEIVISFLMFRPFFLKQLEEDKKQEQAQ